jgi:hypothetical protein
MRHFFWLFICLAIPAQANTEANLSVCLSLAKQQASLTIVLASDCSDLFMALNKLGLLNNSSLALSNPVSVTQLELLANSMQTKRQLLPVQHAELEKLLADFVTTEAHTAEQFSITSH